MTTTADDVPGSLRGCINLVNSPSGPCLMGGNCTITFTAGGNYLVSAAFGSLPAITASGAGIDGSVPGSSPNTNPFGQPDNAVIGVNIVTDTFGAPPDGITFSNSGGFLRNVAIGGFNHAIVLGSSSTTTIAGNFIGTDTSGNVAVPNTTGIEINSASFATIGGSDAARNIISANSLGISIISGGNDVASLNYLGTSADLATPLPVQTIGVQAGTGSAFNSIGFLGGGNLISGNMIGISSTATGGIGIQNNLIGTNGNGTAPYVVAQTTGIVAGAEDAIGSNVISGQSGNGVLLVGPSNTLQSNFIGTDPTGAFAVPNGNGVVVTSNLNQISSNTISFNAADGLIVDTGRSNTILGNVFQQNSLMGIDLVAGTGGAGPTPNDAGDADTGGDGFQNFPTINSAAYNGFTMEFNVSIDSSAAPGTGGLIFEVFKSDGSANPQGLEFLGSSGCIAGNAMTNHLFTTGVGSAKVGDKVVMTATNYSDSSCSVVNDGTSEFSFPATTVTPGPGWVVNTNDSGLGSLRQAILDANANDTVVQFAIPPSFATGNVWIIEPLSPLPALTVDTGIDGESQASIYGDTNPNGPEIVVNGALAGAGADGIVIDGTARTIGPRLGQLVINGFGGNGVTVINGQGVLFTNVFIGVNATATASVPNGGNGIAFIGGGSANEVGDGFSTGNVISGNGGDGIFFGPLCDGSSVFGNFIGTNSGGTLALPNGLNGVEVQSTDNLIGGLFTKFHGSSVPSKKRKLIAHGGLPTNLPNVIAFNGGAGVAVTGAAALGNLIEMNSIFNNGGLGIDLGGDGVTPNDPLDADTGPNDLQNYPVLTSVTTTAIEGTLNSEPNMPFAIDFYSNSAPDPSGFGEGKTWLGETTVTTDALGNTTVQLTGTFTAGQFITATATKLDTSTVLDTTSEFSRDLAVGGIFVPPNADLTITKVGPPAIPANGQITFTIAVHNNGPSPAANVSVADPTPQHLTFVSNTGDCTTPFPCNLGTINAGQTEQITAKYSVSGATASVTNVASVSSTTPDPTTSNNSARATVVGNTCPTRAPQLVNPIPDSTGVPSSGTLNWTDVGATSYDVYLGPVSTDGCDTLFAADVHDTSVAYSGLLAGVDYEIRIVAKKNSCNSVSSDCVQFTTCGPPLAPLAGVDGAPTSDRVYSVVWSAVPLADHYIVQESTDQSFTNPTIVTTANLSAPFIHDVPADQQALVLFYRVQAVGNNTCTTEGSPFSKVIRVVVLPPKNGIINVPAGTQDQVTVQVFVPGDPQGSETFTAVLDKPWLISVKPATGILTPAGLTFTVTIDPSQLPNGTFVGTLILNVTPTSSGHIAVNGSTSKSVPISINLVTPVFPVDPNTPTADTIIIPAVGHLIGTDSQWRSDVRIFNNTGADQQYSVNFLTSQASDSKQTTIQTAAGATTALDDIIHNWYGFGEVGDSSAGILEIHSLSSSTASNPLAAIVSSRTFNISTSSGTVGEFIPGILFKNFIGASIAGAEGQQVLSLQQVAQSPAFRTNFGLVEASGSPASLLLSIFNSAGTKLLDLPVSLAGGEQKTFGSLLAAQGITASDARVEVRVTGGTGKVTAYASVVDSASLDPLLVPPTLLGQTTSEAYVLPGVADLNNGIAAWRTDMRILNSGLTAQTANLVFYPEQNSGSPLTTAVTINPNEVKVLDDVLRATFSATNVGGAVHINTVGGSALVVTGRTFNQTDDGTLGQFIPAKTQSDGITAGAARALNVLQVEDSVRFRTNVGLAEMSGQPATVEVSVSLPDSKVTPTIEYQLGPNEFRQVPVGVFGLGDVYNVRVSVTVTSGNGTVTAYGSVIDQTTNAPTYVAAQ